MPDERHCKVKAIVLIFQRKLLCPKYDKWGVFGSTINTLIFLEICFLDFSQIIPVLVYFFKKNLKKKKKKPHTKSF